MEAFKYFNAQASNTIDRQWKEVSSFQQIFVWSGRVTENKT